MLKQLLLGLALSGFAAGGIFGLFAWNLWHSEQNFRTWQFAHGRILGSSIERENQYVGAGSGDSTRGDYWVFRVSYAYEVGGRMYTGTRFSNSPPLEGAMLQSSPSSELLAIARRFPIGAEVPVYYAPNDPERSYLEINHGGVRWSLIWTGASIAVAVACLSLRLVL